MEVGLVPDHIVLDGDPAPPTHTPRKAAQQPSLLYGAHCALAWLSISATAELLLMFMLSMLSLGL